MYILLNREALTINYKWFEPNALCNIAWIEIRNSAYCIAPCTAVAFRGLTEMELKVLYRNTTGSELNLAGLNAALQVMVSIIEAMPLSEISGYEAEVQASCINEEQQGFYKYVPRSLKPALVQELFNSVYNTSSDPEVERLAAQGVWPSLVRNTSPKPAPAAPQAPKPVAAVRTPAKPAKEPGEATTSGKIWAMADQVRVKLELTGYLDVPHLKKLVIDAMLANGVNRSTITTQLSHWQRNRLQP